MTTIEHQRIKIQIEAGYGFYGAKYQKAKTEKEKKEIIEAAIKNNQIKN